ncbi:MAG TPA: hypothetical protein VNJ54_08020, partial [Plantibacter sp.]|uniref:hypothetical protein n=1 Tax=Plantibacter sp. TaxID=1871045 RepID=UPI002C87454C|nr:hypothetical protein [Plantibacter sp.]
MLLVVITAVMEAAQPRVGGNQALSEWLGVMGALLWLASAMFTAAIVASVVQTHTLVGTTAFWFARPIPARDLLVAKILLLFLVLVAFPVACNVAVMLPYHVPPSRMALVALQGIGTRWIVVLVLMCPAALTPSLTRFALLCIGVVAGVAVLSALGLTAMVASPGTDPFQNFMKLQGGGFVGAAERVIDWTPAIVAGVLIFAAALMLLGVHYRTRATRRSLVTGIAALSVAIAVSWVWAWPIFVPHQSTPDWANSAPTLTLDPATAQVDRARSSSRDPWRLVRARAQMSGTPPTWVATESLAGATFAAHG